MTNVKDASKKKSIVKAKSKAKPNPKKPVLKKKKLNLGCGEFHKKGYVNIDISKKVKPDLVWDLNKLPYPFKDGEISEITLEMVYEHLSVHPEKLLKEFYRLLGYNGLLDIKTCNNYHWKSRIKFLFGKYEDVKDYHPYHTKLVKPSDLIWYLKWLGFHVELQKTTKFWGPLENIIPNLFANRVYIKAYKRSEF